MQNNNRFGVVGVSTVNLLTNPAYYMVGSIALLSVDLFSA